MTKKLIGRIAGTAFDARFEEAAAPKTVAAFCKHLPFVSKVGARALDG